MAFKFVAIVPVTVLSSAPRQAPTDVSYHPAYSGKVLFQNTFEGKLPATDYPKVTVSKFFHIGLICSTGPNFYSSISACSWRM